MKAMVLLRPGPVETRPLLCQDMPDPVPGPGEVRVRVRYCGVCRTDLHIVEGDMPPVRLPLIPGHQVIGVVDAVGRVRRKARPGLDGPDVAPGDRVGLPWLYSTCGRCDFCRSGRENLCNDIRFTGYSFHGGYAGYVIAKSDFLVKIPPGFSDLDAAPLMCAGIIGYRSLKIAGIKPGDTVGLFGFGASAHLALQVARHRGCKVLVFTRSRAHQDLALELGAEWAGRAEEGPPGSCDGAVSFAPAGSVIPLALRALKRGGTLAVNAVHLDSIPEFGYSLLYWEKAVRSVANATREDAREFLELAANMPLKVSTEVFPLEKANEALGRLKEGLVQGEAVLAVEE